MNNLLKHFSTLKWSRKDGETGWKKPLYRGDMSETGIEYKYNCIKYKYK